jgi:hypothetical protein
MISDQLVKKFALSIAFAEGFFSKEPDPLPRRCNNPGDLTDEGDVGLGTALSTGIGATHITIYANVSDGWNALYRKVRRALSGSSETYHLEDSIAEFGYKYSGKSAVWAVNFSKSFGCTIDTTLLDLVRADQASQDSDTEST